MSSAAAPLPGFKIACTCIGALYVLLATFTLAQGAHATLQPFGVPEAVLASPHFADFFHWLFVHMNVIGLLIVMLGRFVQDAQHQRTAARILCLVTLHYAYLDIRTSVWGSGLYAHPKSLVPVAIDLIVTVCFGYLGLQKLPLAPGDAHELARTKQSA